MKELEEQKPPHRLLDLSICSTLNRSMFPDPTDIYVSIKSFIQVIKQREKELAKILKL